MLMETEIKIFDQTIPRTETLAKLHQKVSVFFLTMQKEKVRTVIRHLSRRC